jgi:hypothetical protein
MTMSTRIATAAITLCALIGGLLLCGTVAQAKVTHDPLFQIREITTGSGPEFPARLSSVGNITVDGTHLWVAEHIEGESSNRVDEFTAATGAFKSQLAHSADYSTYYEAVAIGHVAGEAEPEVYLAESHSAGGSTVGVYSEADARQATWTGAETPTGLFGSIGNVAVDNSTSLNDPGAGDVYVDDPSNGVVDVFHPQAGGAEKYVTQLTGISPSEGFSSLGRITVDSANGDVLVADNQGVDVFEPTLLGEFAFVRRITGEGAPSGSFRNLSDVGVDGSDGDIYVVQEQQNIVEQFSSAGAYIGDFEVPLAHSTSLRSVAVDSSDGDLYVGDGGRNGVIDAFGPSLVVPDVETSPATDLAPMSATLNGTVDPDRAGAATCKFEWGTSSSLGETLPCAAGVAEGEAPVAVGATLSGLQPDTTYYYLLQATNAHGTNIGESSQVREFVTPGPGIEQQAVAEVAAGSATLDAQIDPHGAPTTYYFQYGTSTAYESEAPAAPGVAAGSGEGEQSVSVHLQGLAPSTIYHYRVVVSSTFDGQALSVQGPDQTFTTQAAGAASALPDGRGWEMVTPLDKQGAGLSADGNEQGADIQAAADGGAITYVANAPFAANPAGSRALEATQVFSRRQEPGSWATQDITTPHNELAPLAIGALTEYKLFSNDLSLGLVLPQGHTPLPPLPPGSEKTMYLRNESGGYEALVTAANVPAGTKFGGDGEGVESPMGFAGATPDLSHVVVSSPVSLTSTAFVGEDARLYEWSGGQLHDASVLPDGELTAGALGLQGSTVRHAISDDGSRVIFTGRSGHLYLRDMTLDESVQIDAAQGTPEPNQNSTSFQTASAEGTRVFFTSTERLTADATATEGTLDLYEFEVTSGAGQPLAGTLTDLTVDRNPEESAQVLGVIGASEDGTAVYFVASGVLGEAAAHGAKPGTANLYVERYDASARTWTAPTLIALLPGEDSPTWGNGSSDLDHMTSRVSPNGRYLAFMSDRSLTGYDNQDVNSGAADEEVFLYDSSTSHLSCASCNPTGARPAGLLEQGNYEENLVDYAKTWEGRWIAGNLPGWTTRSNSAANYQSRYLSNSGRLFFNSSDALVPGDVNGKEDVYEYEPAGIGSCGPGGAQSASTVFSESAGGCDGLISAGTSPEESAFLDASESGGDVFFLTLSQLAPADIDTSIDLYDAHECTAAAPCAAAAALTPPPCSTGDACKPGPTPQPASFGAPASATFSGAGNVAPVPKPRAVSVKSLTRAQKLARALKSCVKHDKSRRKRATCERQANKRYGAKKPRAGKSSSSRTRRQSGR